MAIIQIRAVIIQILWTQSAIFIDVLASKYQSDWDKCKCPDQFDCGNGLCIHRELEHACQCPTSKRGLCNDSVREYCAIMHECGHSICTDIRQVRSSTNCPSATAYDKLGRPRSGRSISPACPKKVPTTTASITKSGSILPAQKPISGQKEPNEHMSPGRNFGCKLSKDESVYKCEFSALKCNRTPQKQESASLKMLEIGILPVYCHKDFEDSMRFRGFVMEVRSPTLKFYGSVSVSFLIGILAVLLIIKLCSRKGPTVAFEPTKHHPKK